MRTAAFLLLAWLLPGCLVPGLAETLFVGAKEDDRLVVIDLATGERLASLPTGAGPHEVAVSADGRRVAVVAYGRRRASKEVPRDIVDIFDARTGRHVTRIVLAPYHAPHGIVWLADGRHLLVTAERERKLLVVDTKEAQIAAAIETGATGSHLLAYDPERAYAYVTSLGDGVVSVIDVAAGRLMRTVPSGRQAEGVALTPDGQELWVTNRGEDTVTVFRLPDFAALARFPSPGMPIRVAFSPDGRLAAISHARAGTVALIDRVQRKRLALLTFASTTAPAPFPVGLLFHPDGKRLYVALTGPGIIAEIDLASREVTRRFHAGAGADGMAISLLPFHGQTRP
ncbi:MAG: YncE family protein [Alphaproteobacteria bacterium]|nr:MAG: YncE family protein [Alphaproteobacteria bacterium]